MKKIYIPENKSKSFQLKWMKVMKGQKRQFLKNQAILIKRKK